MRQQCDACIPPAPPAASTNYTDTGRCPLCGANSHGRNEHQS